MNQVADQTVQPAPAPAPAPAQRRTRRTVEEVYGELRAEGKRWVRAAAAYHLIGGAINSLTGQLQPGERKRAIPLLMTQPTKFCEEDVELVFDLNKLTPEEAQYTLVPLNNCQVPVINESLDAMYNLLVELRLLQGLPAVPPPKVATGGAPPVPVQQPPANG